MEPYERLLGDALRGDGTLFGSRAGVEAAWRVVDPLMKGDGPVLDYGSTNTLIRHYRRIKAGSD